MSLGSQRFYNNYKTRSVSIDSFYVKFSRTDKMHAFCLEIQWPNLEL